MRTVRHRQKKRLSDVALKAALSRQTVSVIERGNWGAVTWRAIAAVADALDVVLGATASWKGAELDRTLDEGHARLVGLLVARLLAAGWIAKVEVSYSEYGERGSIDVLGWHEATATLAVFEIKTELGSVEGLLRPLDVKVRLAPTIARKQFGWRAARVARIVVFPESRTVRRHVQRHAAVLDEALPARTVEIRKWLDAPAGVVRGRWFLSNSDGNALTRNPSTIRRVRPKKTAEPAARAAAAERG